MKKIFFAFLLFASSNLFAGYNYHWALEQKFTTRSSINQIRWINKLIVSMKTHSNWNTLDAFYVFAVETQQQALWNWKAPGTSDATEVNSLTWVAKQGYTGDGTTSYINTNYNISTGSQYTQNSASAGFYCRTNLSVGGIGIGVIDGGLNGLNLGNRSVADAHNYSVNTATGNSYTSTESSAGLIYGGRGISTTSVRGYNGSQSGSSANTSAAPPNLKCYALARNSNGSATGFTAHQYSMVFFGSSSVSQSNLSTDFNDYMTSLGTNVY